MNFTNRGQRNLKVVKKELLREITAHCVQRQRGVSAKLVQLYRFANARRFVIGDAATATANGKVNALAATIGCASLR